MAEHDLYSFGLGLGMAAHVAPEPVKFVVWYNERFNAVVVRSEGNGPTDNGWTAITKPINHIDAEEHAALLRQRVGA